MSTAERLIIRHKSHYYEHTAEAHLVPRPVNNYSPLIYSGCDFTLNESGEMFYRPHSRPQYLQLTNQL